MDDFDHLLFEAVKKKYPQARVSISWIISDTQEERMLNQLKGYLKREILFRIEPKIADIKMYQVYANPIVYDFPMSVFYSAPSNMMGLGEELFKSSYDISQQEMLKRVKTETPDFRL